MLSKALSAAIHIIAHSSEGTTERGVFAIQMLGIILRTRGAPTVVEEQNARTLAEALDELATATKH